MDNLILVLFYLDFYNFNYKNVSKLVLIGYSTFASGKKKPARVNSKISPGLGGAESSSGGAKISVGSGFVGSVTEGCSTTNIPRVDVLAVPVTSAAIFCTCYYHINE